MLSLSILFVRIYPSQMIKIQKYSLFEKHVSRSEAKPRYATVCGTRKLQLLHITCVYRLCPVL